MKKIEVAVEEEDRRADLGASSGSRGRPPANMICGFRIAEGQKIESQMCFKLDSLIVDPPCELPYCCEGGNRVICMPQGKFTTLDAKAARHGKIHDGSCSSSIVQR